MGGGLILGGIIPKPYIVLSIFFSIIPNSRFLPTHVFSGLCLVAAGVVSIITGLLSHLRRKAQGLCCFGFRVFTAAMRNSASVHASGINWYGASAQSPDAT